MGLFEEFFVSLNEGFWELSAGYRHGGNPICVELSAYSLRKVLTKLTYRSPRPGIFPPTGARNIFHPKLVVGWEGQLNVGYLVLLGVICLLLLRGYL